MGFMNYTDENVMVVAQKIVDDMDLDDLMSYVYDDLCAIMDKDEELFNCNVEHFNLDEN
jgi:hypothetical protein